MVAPVQTNGRSAAIQRARRGEEGFMADCPFNRLSWSGFEYFYLREILKPARAGDSQFSYQEGIAVNVEEWRVDGSLNAEV